MPDLPGLYKHSNLLESLLVKHQNQLWNHLQENNLRVELYASDWIFALYTNVIPTSQVHHFFDMFFKDGWAFFYRFTLTFLKVMSSRILQADEMSDIIDFIKQPMSHRNSQADTGESVSLMSSIGKYFKRQEQDTVKELLGISYLQFTSDE